MQLHQSASLTDVLSTGNINDVLIDTDWYRRTSCSG